MDLKGKNFGSAVTLYSSTEEGPYAITTKDLNSKITNLLQSYEMEVTVAAYDFEFRIASSISDAADSFYSNVVSTQITPFIGDPEYPKVYLPGAYCSWEIRMIRSSNVSYYSLLMMMVSMKDG